MDPLAEFVAVQAPGLLGAVPARAGADPDPVGRARRTDAEVAQLLADVWVAGPPYDDALVRMRRRLAAGFAADTDLVDLGSAPTAPVPEVVPAPERITRLQELVAQRVERRYRRARGERFAQGLTAAALAVLVGVGGFQLFHATAEQRSSTRPGATGSTHPGPPAGPGVASPSATATTCPYSVCQWETVGVWTGGVKQAVRARLDPDATVFTSVTLSPMVTTVSEVPHGRMMEAGFGTAVAGSRQTFGLHVTVTTRRDLLPRCGATTGTACRVLTTPTGERVTVSQRRRLIEVFHHGRDGSWVRVVLDGTQRLPFTAAQLAELASDPLLQLPR